MRVESTELVRWLKRSDKSAGGLPEEMRQLYPADAWQQLETNLKYEGYIARERQAIEKADAGQHLTIPASLDYEAMPGLRREAKQKLTAIRPLTFGQASRVSGITPADLAVIQIWIRKQSGRQANAD